MMVGLVDVVALIDFGCYALVMWWFDFGFDLYFVDLFVLVICLLV